MDAADTKENTWRGPYNGEMRHVCNASLRSLTLGLFGNHIPGDRQDGGIAEGH